MRTFSAFLCLAAAAPLNAAVLTVSNEPGQPAQYSDINAAYTAADPNDTLYISGSPTSYGGLFMEKPLTLIGAGYNLPASAPTTLDYIYLKDGCSGTNLIGLSFVTCRPNYDNSTGITGLLIERCAGSVSNHNGLPVDQVLVKNSNINSINMASNWTNVLITNNLITGQVSGSSSPSVLISNNVFASNGSYVLQGVTYAVVSNNIFYGSSPSYDGGGVENCAFNNNLSFGTADDDLPPTGSNVGSGNQVGVDPQFVNVPDFTGDPDHNYDLQAGSPANNAGTDNTDLGVYGGGNPLVGAFDGRARIPLVTNFVINNSTIGEGGSLNVTVEGTKHD